MTPCRNLSAAGNRALRCPGPSATPHATPHADINTPFSAIFCPAPSAQRDSGRCLLPLQGGNEQDLGAQAPPCTVTACQAHARHSRFHTCTCADWAADPPGTSDLTYRAPLLSSTNVMPTPHIFSFVYPGFPGIASLSPLPIHAHQRRRSAYGRTGGETRSKSPPALPLCAAPKKRRREATASSGTRAGGMEATHGATNRFLPVRQSQQANQSDISGRWCLACTHPRESPLRTL
jgi:hypothetical protein